MPNAFQELLNQLGGQAHLPNTPGNNPLVNFAMGQPLQIRDATGSAELTPYGAFSIKGNNSQDFRTTIDPLDRSVTIGKGIFDLTGGIGVPTRAIGANTLTTKPSPYVRLEFNTNLDKKPSAPVFLEQFINPGTPEDYSSPSEARAYADEEIRKVRSANPYSYVMDRLGNRL